LTKLKLEAISFLNQKLFM